MTRETRVATATRTLVPHTKLEESADAVLVRAQLPGADASSIQVVLERGVLTISARAEFEAPANARALLTEFEGGDYRRTFHLSDEADGDRISAVYEHGVLTVTVPQRAPTSRRIEVRAGV